MTRAIFITTPDELDALGDALEELIAAKPETGEQWAEICALEDKIERAKKRGVYGEMCSNPDLCADKGYCPRDPSCCE